MSSAISLSSASRASLSSLQDIAGQMATIQKHLSTGKRVNDPTDNPVAFFTASGLTARAASLNSLMDGVGNAQKTFDAANAGIKALQSLLQSAQNLATQALTSSNTLVKVTGTNATAYATSSVIASTSGTTTKLKAGDTITVGDGTTTATYTAANNDTMQTFLNAVNNTANLKVAASLNASGQIQLQATGTNNITIGGSVTSASGLAGATGLTAGTTSFAANATRQSLAQQFDLIRTQIDQAAGDAGYNGVNLLAGGSLSVAFNETGSSKLSVSGVTYSSASLGISAVNSGSGGQFQTDTEINAALSGITSALATLQSQSAAFGASTSVMGTRQTFTSSLIDTLNAGADDLVNADTSEDSALLMALQARQQIAQTALSLSSQQNQTALRLFGLS